MERDLADNRRQSYSTGRCLSSPLSCFIHTETEYARISNHGKKTRPSPKLRDLMRRLLLVRSCGLENNKSKTLVTFHYDAVSYSQNFDDGFYLRDDDPKHIWSHRTGKASNFNTSFSFKIDARNLSADGHGICFFLVPMGAQLPAYSVGGFLNLFTRKNIRLRSRIPAASLATLASIINLMFKFSSGTDKSFKQSIVLTSHQQEVSSRRYKQDRNRRIHISIRTRTRPTATNPTIKVATEKNCRVVSID
ncbi:hypothetical protein ARALYDRAFT_358759 [Arabidopsis lyrata subsp. lyrata]|uniref:Legume lectin domain-containing protein n=1 Tax=Arabidopsis lyrata subsp. lyrata TaxID=81972 RepID=D7MU02_ARALL|nr:hypothetical protein ARALYDRAFT_358759 [Arabidopsis lyrata subsp. lyrata]